MNISHLRPKLIALFATLGILFVFPILTHTNSVYAQSTVISIEPITWDVVGLDSNSPASGPQHFPVGARVCNISGSPVSNIDVDFTWLSANTFINSRPGSLTSINITSLAAGDCYDAYFEIEITQVAGAYDTTREYIITATAGVETASIPQPREIYVEHLISQNRNATVNVTYGAPGSDCNTLTSVAAGGSLNMIIGQSYRICLFATTATQGYEQLESFLSIPNTVFQVTNVETDYSANTSGNVNTSNHPQLYADACYWESDPNSPNYLACNVSSLKSGGTVLVAYDVTIISTGPGVYVLNSLIYDFSGSSFHYNSDFGSAARFANIIDPSSSTISKQFTPGTIGLGGVSTLVITISNPNGGALSGYNFVDPLPGDMVVAAPATFSTNGCGTPTFAPVAGSNILTFDNGTVAANGTCTISVSVTASTVQTYNNITNNLFVGTIDTGNNATADLIVTSTPPPPACVGGVPLASWTFESTGTVSAPLPTSSMVTASAAAGAGLFPAHDADRIGTAGSSSWATDRVQTGALNTTLNQYFEFTLDTTGISEVDLSYWADRTPQGPQSAQLFWGLTGTESNTTADPITGTWVNHGHNINTGLNASGNTVFRLYVFNSGNSSNGHAIHIDDVLFTGCVVPNPPTITKSFSPNPIGVGPLGTSTLTFTVVNPNSVTTLTGVSFTDNLPAGMSVAAPPNAGASSCGTPTWSPVATDTTLNFSSGTVAPGGICTITVDVTSSVAGPNTNITGFITATESGENSGITGSANATLNVLSPPSIDKQFSPNPIVENGISTLTFTIVNPNVNDAISGVAFSDTFPAGVVINTPSNAVSDCGGLLTAADGTNVVSLSGGNIAAGGSCTISVNVTAATAGSYLNTSNNVSHVVSGVTYNGNTTSDTLVVDPPTPSISILKQVGASATGPWLGYEVFTTGDDVYYQITIENTGDVPFSPVNVTDPNVNTAGCTWTDPLPVADAFDEDHISTCIIGPVSAVDGTHVNTATVNGTYSATSYTDTSSATYSTVDLTFLKVANPTTYLNAGDVINYTFTVTNVGTATLNGPITIDDDQSTDESCPALNTIGDNDNFFDPGESIDCTATYTITPTDVTNGSVTNIAFATIDGFDSPTDTETVINPNVAPEIGLAKTVSSAPTNNNNGTYTLTYTLLIENTGDVALNNVQVVDSLSTTFTGATGFVVDSVTASVNLTVNPGYNGNADTNLLAGTDTLAIGASGTITLTVTVTPGANLGPYNNTATVNGTSPGGTPVSDVSDDNAVTTDESGDGDPTNDSDPTPVSFTENPEIGLAKTVSSAPTNNNNGTYTLTYTLLIENTGDVALNNVQVVDNLSTTFAGATGFVVDSVTASVNLTVNPGYNGNADTNLLAGTDTLAIGASGTITLTVTVTPGANLGPYNNTATVNGTSPGGTPVSDVSDDNAVTTDESGDGDPTNDSDPTPVSFTENPEIGLAKTVSSAPTNNNNGTYTLTYTLLIENTGDVALNNVQVVDSLSTTFTGATGFVVDSVTTSVNLTVNLGYNGNADTNLLAGTDTLAIGASGTITLTVTVTPGANLGPYNNTATANGTSPGGTPVSDVSDDNAVTTDESGDGDPTNDSDPTPVSFTENPEIGLAKTVSSAPTNNNNGTYTLTYTLLIENTGDVALNNVQVVDSLSTTFTGATGFVVDSVTASVNLTVNPGYNGNADTNLLAGTDTLAIGASGTITLTVTVTPGANLGPYNNTATANGTSPGGTPVSDVSDDNAVTTDESGDGDPTNDSDPTPVSFTENPEIGLAKTVSSAPTNNNNGTYTLTYTLLIENTGDVALNNVQVVDNLSTTFAGATGFVVDSVTTSVNLTVNPGYNGNADTNLLAGTDTLAIGASGTITLTVTVTPGANLGPYNNTATANGTSPGGTPVSDVSDDNAVTTDESGDGDPTNDSDPTPVSFTENPEIGLAKTVSSAPTNNNNGTYTLTYTLLIENTGDVALNNVQVVDSLSTTFTGATGFVVDSVTASVNLTVNPGYNGNADTNLLAGTDTLAIGASGTITLTVTVTPGANLGPYNNTATANGTSPGGTPVSDVSDDNAVTTDESGDGDPTNDSDPTPVSFSGLPRIGIAKSVTSPTNNGNGTYTVTYTLNVENLGNVDLLNVQVTDDLTSEFGTYEALLVDVDAPTEYTVSNINVGTLTPATTTYDGATNQALLAGTDTIAVGGIIYTITFDVTFYPDFANSPFTNQAIATGETGTPDGTPETTDLSDDGIDPDPNGTGNPNEPGENDPTPIIFAPTPNLAISKTNDVGGGTTVGSSFTWILTVTNTGTGDATFLDGNTILTDDLPPTGLTYGTVSIVNNVGITNAANIDCNITGTSLSCVANGADVTIANTSGSFDVTIVVTANTQGSYTNPDVTCSIDPNNSIIEIDETDNACNADTVTVDMPNISAIKTDSLANDVNGNGLLDEGDTIGYTITITNNGTADANSVVFTDIPDSNTTLVVGSVMPTQGTVISGNTVGNTMVNVDVGTVTASGGTVTINYTVTLNSGLPSTVISVQNQGVVSGANFPDTPTNDPDTSTGDDPTQSMINQPITEVAITVFDPAISKIGFLQAGELGLQDEEIEWFFTVSNVGSATGFDIVVSDELRPELRVESLNVASPMIGTVDGQLVTVYIPSLAPGETVMFSIMTTVLTGGEIDNVACLAASNYNGTACATAQAIEALPNTGETPWWRNWVIGLMAIIPIVGLWRIAR